MTEKTKNVISYAHRTVFSITILIFMCFSEKLKDVMWIAMPILFISAGIVGFVTNRNYLRYPALPTSKGNIPSIVENTIEILMGVVFLSFIFGK